MNDINASVGLANLPNVENILRKCRGNAKYYSENLKNLGSIKLFDEVQNTNPSYWIYTLKILYNRKNDFIKHMTDKDIVVSQVHARNDRHSCLKNYVCNLPNLDILELQIVSIPVGWWLSEDKCEYIVNCIKEFDNSLFITTLNTEKNLNEYSNLLYQMNGYTDEKPYELSILAQESIYIMKLNNKIISTAKLLIEDKLYQPVGHIEDVVTNNDHRNNGYGKHLIKYLINIALTKNNCYKVILNCGENLDEFYTKCGMIKTGSSFSIYK